MNLRNSLLQTLTLFTSFATLLCCALPALLVSIGAGAVMAGIVGVIPQLVWISEHKTPLFVFAGFMLALSGISSYRNRNAPCPANLDQMKSCLRLRRWSRRIFYFSSLIYAVGFFFAFLAAHLGNQR